jgi:hypothetical protein
MRRLFDAWPGMLLIGASLCMFAGCPDRSMLRTPPDYSKQVDRDGGGEETDERATEEGGGAQQATPDAPAEKEDSTGKSGDGSGENDQ